MGNYFDDKETRSENKRQKDLAASLPIQILRAKAKVEGFSDILRDIKPEEITSRESLGNIKVLRKTDLISCQKKSPPFGGFYCYDEVKPDNIYQSPGPIYEPGLNRFDWWRTARFFNAVGITSIDLVQNCFSYHFTPAGQMMENGIHALGATVFPAGTGQTELQARVASDLKATAYCGTPEYLLAILEKAEEMSLNVSSLKKAAVGGGPLFPNVRAAYVERGINCLQSYGTADLGMIAYETIPDAPLVVEEDLIVEIVTPGTGSAVPDGEIGEVLVTTLNPNYPLIRFATGDLSAIETGISECGRTNTRLIGWKGRADQATKVKGMFVRPEQVAELITRHPEIEKARIEITLKGLSDFMVVKLIVRRELEVDYTVSVKDIFKLRAHVELVASGSLPNDGKVIDDKRPIE
jgi:phenylacetate-CoA ligase